MKKSLIILVLGCLCSCYSFTGSSLSPDLKTIYVKSFPNNSALNNPNLTQDFTLALQQKFLRNTSLKGSDSQPDIVLEGEISNYSIQPTSITAENQTQTNNFPIQATQNKLIITIKVHYENKREPEKNFDRIYTDEAVFGVDTDNNTIETLHVKTVNDRIINKIFNDIAANW